MTCHRLVFGISLLYLASLGCATVKPVVIDTKTQLENQVLGAFQRLEQDLILASSVRGEGGAKLSPLQREALEAMMIREFYRDDIDALKQQQVVGEGKDGLLLVITKPDQPERAQEVEKLVKRENDSRTIIMRRAIQQSRDLQEKDLPLVQQVFARLNRQTAQPGDRVQLESGRWETVKAPEAEAKEAAK
jgi:hypothetical protein